MLTILIPETQPGIRVTPYLLQDLIAAAPVLVWDMLLEGKPEIWCSFLSGHVCFLLRLMVSKLNKDVSWYEMLFINFLWNSVKFHMKGSFPSLQLCQWAEALSGSSSVWGPWLLHVVCHRSLPSVCYPLADLLSGLSPLHIFIYLLTITSTSLTSSICCHSRLQVIFTWNTTSHLWMFPTVLWVFSSPNSWPYDLLL